MAAAEKDPKAIELAKTLEHIPWCDDYEKMISGVLCVVRPQRRSKSKLTTTPDTTPRCQSSSKAASVPGS